MNKVKRIIIGPRDETGALHHKSQFDLTLHIKALNTRLSNHGHSAVGALCFIGVGLRHSRVVSPIAYGSMGQIDFHISDVHILNLHSVDPTNAREILGKWDMFQPLLQSRERVQMVDADDSGGWIVDGGEWPEKDYEGNDPRAWNMHVGMKSHSINVMESAASVVHILNCAQALKIRLQPHIRTEFQPIPSMASQAESQMPVTYHSTFMKLRWRIDLALSSIYIALPLGYQPEGAQLDMGRNLCTKF